MTQVTLTLAMRRIESTQCHISADTSQRGI